MMRVSLAAIMIRSSHGSGIRTSTVQRMTDTSSSLKIVCRLQSALAPQIATNIIESKRVCRALYFGSFVENTLTCNALLTVEPNRKWTRDYTVEEEIFLRVFSPFLQHGNASGVKRLSITLDGRTKTLVQLRLEHHMEGGLMLNAKRGSRRANICGE